MTDSSKLQYYTGYNTYKNVGVFSTSVVVSGTLAAGTIGTYSTPITVTEAYKFSTALVKTTDIVGGTPRWQSFPPANYYDVPCSGPAASLTVTLSLAVAGSTITFQASTLNPYGSTLTWTTTTIDFVYAVHTTAV